jgi:hypothetical protein
MNKFSKILITTFLSGALLLGGYFIVKAANDTTFSGNSQVPCFEYYTGFFQCARSTNPQLSPFNAQSGQLDSALETVAVPAYEKFTSCVGAICQFYPLQMMESASSFVGAGGGNSPAGYGLWLGDIANAQFRAASGSNASTLAYSGVIASGLFADNGASMARLHATGTALDINIASGGITGAKTPSDALANPTDATDVISYNVVWDSVGAIWRRWKQPLNGTGIGSIALFSNNGTGYDPYTQNFPVATSCSAVTTTGACSVLNHSLMPKATHTWTIIVTGAPASDTILLEGSIDGVNYFTVDTSTITTSEMRFVSNKLVSYMRGNVTTLVGGVSPTITVQIVSGGQN